MITESEKAHMQEMAEQAAVLESKCATGKPAKLPQHELAFYLMNPKFKVGQVLVGLGWLVAFVVVEIVATM